MVFTNWNGTNYVLCVILGYIRVNLTLPTIRIQNDTPPKFANFYGLNRENKFSPILLIQKRSVSCES